MSNRKVDRKLGSLHAFEDDGLAMCLPSKSGTFAMRQSLVICSGSNKRGVRIGITKTYVRDPEPCTDHNV